MEENPESVLPSASPPPDGDRARRGRSTLDANSAPLTERGTSGARFLIVVAIFATLLAAATNVLGVWSTPWQAEARKEAAHRTAVRKEEARKAAIERDRRRRSAEPRPSANAREVSAGSGASAGW